ncbi:MAG: hypothetical protein PHU63_02495 [Candidatus ainarchaeum sp.]|nr:hypothetical protein [Candidatus ainarchaeum sp.]
MKNKKDKKITGAKVCIICRGEMKDSKNAVKIKDDQIITSIRKIKEKMNMATKNELYVCNQHKEEHMKRRKSFEKSILLTAILAFVIFVLLSIIPPITTGNINLSSILLGLLIGIMLLLLNGFIKYTPDVEVKK